ncbi:MAG TPA: hypothetical protein P5135_04140 [Gemmatimonadales bacterium]|nr:hypothetical protein [Gemmatimonadales bacterium]
MLALIQEVAQAGDSSLARFQQGIPTEAPPLPGGVSVILRIIFNAPLWAWLLAIVLGGALAFVALRWVWTHRQALREWFTTRDRGMKAAVGVVLVAVFGLVGFTGVTSWEYMQHDNGFCVSCHVMEGPWNKFSVDAGKHSDLQCHDCHQQSMYASTRQLVLWVANRPQDIPEHAPVPNARCETCHEVNSGSEDWERIATTAGHRTHLESDSTALKDVQCVTCHGAEVHAFLPASQTCGQSGCHENLKITLGKMAEQTTWHCNTCHQFTAEVPLLATRDSAAGTLRPGVKECTSCHQMKERLGEFDVSRDPHGGTCGTCHNPHTQETPQEAGKTCTEAGCHADWRSTPFHTGTAHRAVGEQCLTCHQAHAAKVDASDCVACHEAVRAGDGTLRPPLPFDTTRALRDVASAPSVRHAPVVAGPGPSGHPVVAPVPEDDSPVRGKGDVPPPDLRPPIRTSALPPPAVDTFPHARHTSLSCITCHVPPVTQRGNTLTFAQPRGCDICHHQAPRTNDCARCHARTALATPLNVPVSVTVPEHPARTREVAFAHEVHDSLTCVACHTTPVSLAPTAAVRSCTECHAEHHAEGRACASCHSGRELTTAHADDVAASHRACDACHTASTVRELTPDRSFCLTCHQPQQAEHYAPRECTTCHFLASPADFRARLVGGTPR